MELLIREDSLGSLVDYASIPIAFEVKSRLGIHLVDSGLGGIRLVEETVVAYVKDYDSMPGERPASWPQRFNTEDWAVIAAFDGATRVGGAVIAWNTPGVDMLHGRDDLAVLWDIRVHPDWRGRGVGRALFDEVVRWAVARNCASLEIETQDINVPACRFYHRQGCTLKSFTIDAYPDAPGEAQLIWQLALSRVTGNQPQSHRDTEQTG